MGDGLAAAGPVRVPIPCGSGSSDRVATASAPQSRPSAVTDAATAALGQHQHPGVRIVRVDPLRRNYALIRERRRHADVGQHDIRVVFLDRPQQAVEAVDSINQLDRVNLPQQSRDAWRTR